MTKHIGIIGAGPGGYVAAIRGAQLGAKVTLIEMNKIGGTCLNYGCIPTKTLYKNAEILNTAKHIEEYGISFGEVSFDLEKVRARKNDVVSTLVGGIEQLLAANGIEVVYGLAEVLDKNVIQVKNDHGVQDIEVDHIIIATGSRPNILPLPGFDLPNVHTSKEMLEMKKIPEKLVVIGGGVVGMEMACIYNAFGSDVTVIEYEKQILTQVDKDIAKRLQLSLKKKGICLNVGHQVTKIEETTSGMLVHAVGKKGDLIIEADQVLLSTGRKPNVDFLDLDAIGVEYSCKGITVDKNFMTSQESIYAIGDVNGQVMLAHNAEHQGMTAVNHIMGVEDHINHNLFPNCIFIFPEVATVGLSEDYAKEQGMEVLVSKFQFAGNGKALALGESEGLVKVIASKEYKVLGVQIIGPHASDLIHEALIAINHGLTVDDIAHTIHAHPTLSEAYVEAVMGIKGEAIHIVPKKKRK